jgi:hypothetical protein
VAVAADGLAEETGAIGGEGIERRDDRGERQVSGRVREPEAASPAAPRGQDAGGRELVQDLR